MHECMSVCVRVYNTHTYNIRYRPRVRQCDAAADAVAAVDALYVYEPKIICIDYFPSNMVDLKRKFNYV